jgi:branched-chain amino acid transport system ATP-binding protein
MTLVETKNLNGGYGDLKVLFGIDFHILEQETVAIIGSNGAGKSTFLKFLAGQNTAARNMIWLNGDDVGGLQAEEIAKLGVSMVPEGRKLFPRLSVIENIEIGTNVGRSGFWSVSKVLELFPIIAQKRNALPSTLSGGQQQMVAIARALVSNASLLLLDEISLGLAPVTINDLYKVFPEIKAGGASIIVVEQNIEKALSVADRFYCIRKGAVSLTGKCESASRSEIKTAYFGDYQSD